MKALEDCKWEVEISEGAYKFYFYARTYENTGVINEPLISERDYKTQKGAINAWKKFAEINGYKNYEIID